MSGDILKQYSDTTNGVVEYLKKQLGNVGLWQNIPGSLVKVSTSPAGYVWGLGGNNDVYVCQEPCSSGGWKLVPQDPGIKIIDITTDSTSVYVHTTNDQGQWGIMVKSVTNSDDWRATPAPFLGDAITNTNGYLWVSGQGKTAFCAKPCTTGGWNIREGDAHRLLGAGGTTVFAAEPGSLGVSKTDETAQTGWQPVGGFEGTGVSALGAEADNTVLYGADASKLYRCEGTCETKDQLEVVNAQGFVPIQSKGSVSVNPSTKNVWMAASSNGVNGNLFARLDRPDAQPILDVVEQNEQARDRMFNSLGGTVEVQTAKMASKMARQQASEAIQKSLDLSAQQQKTDSEIRVLKRKIDAEKGAAMGFREKMTPLTILLAALCLVVILYVLAGWLLPTSVTMFLAFLILGVGFGVAIYFSVHK